jgi:hypothetical protein
MLAFTYLIAISDKVYYRCFWGMQPSQLCVSIPVENRGVNEMMPDDGNQARAWNEDHSRG